MTESGKGNPTGAHWTRGIEAVNTESKASGTDRNRSGTK